MIGRHHGRKRRVAMLAGALGIVAVGVVFAARPATHADADPPGHARRTAEVRSRAASVFEALAAFDTALADAVAEVRLASGQVGRGDDEPNSEPLEEAARLIEHADGERAHVEAGLSELAGLQGCRAHELAGTLGVSAERLADLVSEIRDAAPLARAVAAVRRHADSTVRELGAAAAALDDAADGPDLASAQRSHARAVESLAAATRAHEEVQALMPTAATWFRTAEQLVRAQGDLIDASLAGDASTAASAVEAYRTAAAEASLADRALAVGLADASASVLGAPLADLANLRNATAEAAGRLGAIADTGTCG